MSDEIEDDGPYCSKCSPAEMAEDLNAMYEILLQLAAAPAGEEWMRARLARAEELLKGCESPSIESAARIIAGVIEDRRWHKPSW